MALQKDGSVVKYQLQWFQWGICNKKQKEIHFKEKNFDEENETFRWPTWEEINN